MSDAVTGAGTGRGADVRRMTFDDNALLPLLFGNHDRHLVRIEQIANVQLSARGNQLAIAGAADDAAIAHKALLSLYERLKRGLSIEAADVDAAVRFARTGAEGSGDEIVVSVKDFGPGLPEADLEKLFAKFSRDDEAEADAEGVKLMVAAHISPDGVPEMFRILLDERKSKPAGLDAMFLSHPLEEDRITATKALIATYPSGAVAGLTKDAPDFQSFKKRLQSLPASPPKKKATR